MTTSRARLILTAAFLAFLAANLLHNRGGVDPAILPAAGFLAWAWWRPTRGSLVGGAICIAVPCFGFVRLNAIVDPSDAVRFINHLALLAGGLLAVAATVEALRRTARAARG